jgi:hypothetical protein
MGTGDSYPVVRKPGHKADHSSPFNAKVKKMWSYESSPPYIFMA